MVYYLLYSHTSFLIRDDVMEIYIAMEELYRKRCNLF